MNELEQMFGKKEKKETLEDIANHLMSTHNNKSITNYLVKRKQKACLKENGVPIGKHKKLAENVKESVSSKLRIDSDIKKLIYDFASQRDEESINEMEKKDEK